MGDQDDFSNSLTRRIKAVQLAKIAAPKKVPALMDGQAQEQKESHIEPLCEQHPSKCNGNLSSVCQQPGSIHKGPSLEYKAFSQQASPVPKQEPSKASTHVAKALVVEEAKSARAIPSSSSSKG